MIRITRGGYSRVGGRLCEHQSTETIVAQKRAPVPVQKNKFQQKNTSTKTHHKACFPFALPSCHHAITNANRPNLPHTRGATQRRETHKYATYDKHKVPTFGIGMNANGGHFGPYRTGSIPQETCGSWVVMRSKSAHLS